MNGNLLDECPIAVPANPFWKVLKTFGRDEFIAGILSVVVTGVTEALLYSLKMPKTGAALLVLAFIGPIFEKFGFFIGHIKDSYDVYRTTPEIDRQPYSHYAKIAFRGGSKSLIQDILVHDPIYVGLMLGGMWVHPATPAWVLVPVAFGIAVLLVALGEVSLSELRYGMFQTSLFRRGFSAEKYLEARFYVLPIADSTNAYVNQIIEDLTRQCFDCRNYRSNVFVYEDSYYKPDLPDFNARTPKVRLRKRVIDKAWTEKSGRRYIDKHYNSLQIVYTRAVEQTEAVPEQHRFFPQRKDKFYFPLEDLSTCSEGIRLFSRKITTSDTPIKTIAFCRHAIYNAKSMFVAVDTIKDEETNLIVIECKVYPGKEAKLKEAMRYIMRKYDVVQTTHGKSDIL